MSDLISRQAALDEIWRFYGYLDEDMINRICIGLSRLPSEKRKGQWRNYEGTLTCSVCETEIDNGIMEYCGDDVPLFCPNCGAKMDGREERWNK